MELKKLYLAVDLVGFWKSSIENNLLFTLAKNEVPETAPDYNIAEAYVFHIMDENSNPTKDAIMVSFKQDGENIILGYRKLRFTIVSINRNEIVFKDKFRTYSFKRPDDHALNRPI